MNEIYKQYIREIIGADGTVESCSFVLPDRFNFSYDVVDRIASEEPQRRAMYWCNERGEKRTVTFQDMKEESDRAASYLQSLGIGRVS